jgi:hypothetical protein
MIEASSVESSAALSESGSSSDSDEDEDQEERPVDEKRQIKKHSKPKPPSDRFQWAQLVRDSDVDEEVRFDSDFLLSAINFSSRFVFVVFFFSSVQNASC